MPDTTQSRLLRTLETVIDGLKPLKGDYAAMRALAHVEAAVYWLNGIDDRTSSGEESDAVRGVTPTASTAPRPCP